jgi:hypothetical protein
MQRGLLADWLSSAHCGSYIQQLHGTIDGPLDPERFESAWMELTEMHPGLRTYFDLDGDEPSQGILESLAPEIDFKDWQDRPSDKLDQALDHFLEDDRRRGFDIAQAPLFRIAVFVISDQSYQFVWTSHHLLFDVILNYESYELNEQLRHTVPEWPGKSFHLHGFTGLPLVISIYAGAQYELEFVYDRAVLDDAITGSILEQFITILIQLTQAGSLNRWPESSMPP